MYFWLIGIDTKNSLDAKSASKVKSFSYTATEDYFVCVDIEMALSVRFSWQNNLKYDIYTHIYVIEVN